MKCSRAKKLISDYYEQIEGATAENQPKGIHELKAHLASCPGCAAELGALRKMKGELRQLRGGEMLPDWFTSKVMASLPEVPLRVLSPAWWQRRVLRLASVPMAAFLALGIWLASQTAFGPAPEVIAEKNHRACLQAYAQYRSQQAPGGSEMLVVGTEFEDEAAQ